MKLTRTGDTDMKNDKTCFWELNEDIGYETQCGEIHVFNEGNPSDNKHTYCPYCGNFIKEIKKQDIFHDEESRN